MKHRKILNLSRKRSITGLLFICPWLIGFLAFYLRSFIQTVIYALSKVESMDTGGFKTTFTGISNFKYAFLEDADFNQILVASLSGMLVDVPLIIFFSLFLAIVLNGKFKGRTVFRALLFLPVIMNTGLIKDVIESAQIALSGGLNSVSKNMTTTNSTTMQLLLNTFMEFGVPRKLIFYISGAVARIFAVVRDSSVQIIIFIAALQAVPSSLYEVAQIEGSTAYETFWKITFPMVSPLIITNVVYTIVDSFVNSNVVKQAENMAFKNFNYGVSSAMSLISTVVVCLALGIICGLISKKTFYYN